MHDRELKLREEGASAKTQIENLQSQLGDRSTKHVMALDMLQEQLRTAAAVVVEQAEQYNRIMGELRLLHSAIQQSSAEQAAQTEAIYEQMRKLVEENRNLRTEGDRLRDEVLSLIASEVFTCA